MRMLKGAMGTKLNCWEFKKCGREAMGGKVRELGICPVAMAQAVHGVNGGNCGGRACWAIADTLCGGKVQSQISIKIRDCAQCDFLKLVMAEEGDQIMRTKDILQLLELVPEPPPGP